MGVTFSTVNQGRTHLAREEKYLGSVNSYNNWLTKLFAGMCGKVQKVEMLGTTKHFNKKSYRKYKQNLPFYESKKEIMRNHLTAGKVNRLTKRLVSALRSGSYSSARVFVGQGADVNKKFWDRGAYGVSFVSHKADLPVQNMHFTIPSYTPLTYASFNKRKDLFDFMRKVEGDLNVQGEVIDFQRTIELIHVDRQVNHDIVASPVYAVNRTGRVGYVGTHYRPETRVETHVNTHYRDTAYRTHVTHIEQSTGKLLQTAVGNQLIDDQRRVSTT